MNYMRQTLFALLLLCAATVRAQFVQVDWSGAHGDSLLPVCTQVIDLPADYAACRYTARIEYPEFQKMGAAEVERYGIASKYGNLPPMPVVECNVGVQAKRAQLDVAFLPVVMRGGSYYRINSYKLVVESVAAPARAAAQGSVSERYAASSVLAAGKWVRVTVKEEGVHKITDSELRKMGFKNPAKVRLFGYGGRQLPEKGLETLPDDLCEVPLWREKGYVLFYANGTLSWEYKGSRYVHTRNVYSLYGGYFLTEGDEPLPFPTVALEPTLQDTVTTFTNVALYEKEEKSLCDYGRVLVDGYDYSNIRTGTYYLNTKGAVPGEVIIDVSFATNGTAMSNVFILNDEKQIGTLSVGRAVGGELGKIVENSFKIKGGVSEALNLVLVHKTNDNSVTGFLDFLRVSYPCSLALRGSSTLFRGSYSGGNVIYGIAGCNKNTKVWDVSSPVEIKELKGELVGNTYSVAAPAGRNSRLVAVDVKGAFPSVAVAGNVPNQNLHALGQTDMVIIVPSNGAFLPAAERLAQAHRTMDGLSVAVVTAQQVYNEFSSGTPDVTAYRRLMKMLYDRAEGADDAPKYLLLMGDSWFDNRLITAKGRSQDELLLCYESQNSVDAIRSYVLEDYAGYLDDGEGASHLSDKVDVGVGRIPVQSVAEANAVVDKIIAYMQNENAGKWQNVVLLLADDGDDSMPNQHMMDADSIAAIFEQHYPSYIVDRVYWDNYPIEKSAAGKRYPAVTKEIYRRLVDGALMVNYSGHGSSNLFSHEMVWKASDMSALSSSHLPFWVTASCDIGPFDKGDNSLAEAALLNPQGAAIGLFTTTRTVMQSYNSVINKEFSKLLMSPVNSGGIVAVGDAVRRAKCNVISYGTDYSENKLQYVLLGDPALRLKYPQYRFLVEKVNGADASTVQNVAAGSLLNVEGCVVAKDGAVAENFTGVLHSTLFDSAETVNTRDNTGLGSHTYTAYTQTLFSGSDSVRGGRFSITMPVPMDINYSNGRGMLNLFAVDSGLVLSAQGSFNNFTVGGTADSVQNDGSGPEIKLYLNTPSFADGDEVNATPCLWVELYDENGINTIGSGIGHDITAIVDNSPHHTYNLNSAYVPSVGDYTRGTIVMPLNALPAGEHKLMLRAWDLYNNSSTAEITFYVVPSLAPDVLDLKVNPSPALAGQPVEIVLSHDRPQSEIDVTVEVFNFQGQVLWSKNERAVCDGFTYSCRWDDASLPVGVYLVRASLASGDEKSTTKTVKIVVVNNK